MAKKMSVFWVASDYTVQQSRRQPSKYLKQDFRIIAVCLGIETDFRFTTLMDTFTRGTSFHLFINNLSSVMR